MKILGKPLLCTKVFRVEKYDSDVVFVRAYLTYYYRFEDLMLMVGGVVEILVKFKLFLECFRVQNVCKPKHWTLYRL